MLDVGAGIVFFSLVSIDSVLQQQKASIKSANEEEKCQWNGTSAMPP